MTILKIFGIILIIFFLARLAKRPFRRRATDMRLSHSGFPKGLEAACPECGVSCKLFIPRFEHLCPEHGWFNTYLKEIDTMAIAYKCNHVYPTSTGGSANMPGPIVDGQQTWVPVPHGHPLPGTDCKLCGSKGGWADSSNPYGIPFPFYFQEETMNDDPTQGDPTELEVEVPADPTFCNHLTRNNTLCRVPVTEDDPCGYHDSDVQREQESALKQTIISILNETLDVNCSLSDFPVDERCPAYDLLRCIMNNIPPRIFRALESDCNHNFTHRIDGFYVCTFCQCVSEEYPYE